MSDVVDTDSPQPWQWFPTIDTLGPADESVAGDPTVERVRAVAELVLAPRATRADIDGVPRSNLDELAAIGVLGPVAPAPAQREIAELLSGACGSTWFCWTQHRTPTEWITGTSNAELHANWADDVASGKALAAVAFAHIRRPGAPTVTAARVDGGWRVSGTLNWVTSWTIADVIAMAAETPDGQLVRFITEPRRREGLLADLPLELAAMGGTHTCPVQLDSLLVRDADVIDVVDKAPWVQRDSVGTANAGPHLFGVSRAAIALLQGTAQQRGDAAGLELAADLTESIRDVRDAAYALADQPDGYIAERLSLRAQALDLAITATTAAVAARSGDAIRLTDPAQRLAREAIFYLVQAQTAPLRAQTLRQWQQRAAR